MRMVLKNIGSLLVTAHDPGPWVAGEEMASVEVLHDAWLVIELEKIACYGEGEVIPFPDDEVLDCKGGMVMPAFCDSHTHLVYAGSREQEYEDKIRGLSYEEIARRGGGILNSAKLKSGNKFRKIPRAKILMALIQIFFLIFFLSAPAEICLWLERTMDTPTMNRKNG